MGSISSAGRRADTPRSPLGRDAVRDVIRWGILGPGYVAGLFATALRATEGHQLRAVGSRRTRRARAFALEHGADRAYGSYRKLVRDPDVDVVYVATPHAMHAEHALLAVGAGKAVVCEKPLCPTEDQAGKVIAAAHASGVFLMEAMWTRFLPVTRQVRQWLRDGAIGDPRLLTCDFGFEVGFDRRSRLFDARLGGGSLLDVGVYTLSMAALTFDREPQHVTAQADLAATGVDEECAVELAFEDGSRAELMSTFRRTTSHVARIQGTQGRITVPSFWQATTATLERPGEEELVVSRPFRVNGYEYEIEEVGRCLAAGLLESPELPLGESLGIVRVMDQVRDLIGVRYPFETGRR